MTGSIVLFDGVCNLCNSSVQFIINHDRKLAFHFAPLQSEFGNAALERLGIPAGNLNTIILIKEHRYWQKSDAILEIAKDLSGAWPLFYVFKLFPRLIRDWIYDRVAKNRYRIFGVRSECMIPTPELKARFIDGDSKFEI